MSGRRVASADMATTVDLDTTVLPLPLLRNTKRINPTRNLTNRKCRLAVVAGLLVNTITALMRLTDATFLIPALVGCTGNTVCRVWYYRT